MTVYSPAYRAHPPAARASARMKLLFVHFSDLDMTGGERMTLRLIEGMRESGYAPVLLTQRSGPLAQAARAGGIETIILPLPKRLDRYDGEILRYSPFRLCASAVDLLAYNIRFGRLVVREAFSAVWCSNIRALLTVGITARILGVPVIWNIWLARQFGSATNWVYDICYLLPARIVTEYHEQAASAFSKRAMAFGGRKLSTVYTGLDPSAFAMPSHAPREDAPVPSAPWHVVSCGRITPRKNFECLLAATALLAARGKPVRVTIVGKPFSEPDRRYFERLKRRVQTDGTSSLVTFAEWQDDIHAVLRTADLYVSSSLAEGLPGAVREAQAAGLPVVATDVGGTREAVQDGVSGLLVPSGDARALAAAIEKVMANPTLAARYGREGRARALELFSAEAFIGNYRAVFRAVARCGPDSNN